ncbi:Uncharacterised protein [Shigella sonnei]|nr:Uncharacterised protein [Shigella sonnei]
MQHLNGTANFFITTNHRIEFALFGSFGKVDGIFFQSLTLVFSTLIVHAFTSTHLFNRLSNVGGGRPCCFQDVGQRAARLKCRQNEQF